MKTLLAFVFVFLTYVTASGQSAALAFHSASRQFIAEKDNEAKAILDEALKKYPGDEKLKALRDQIKDKEKQKQQDKNKENKDEQQEDKEKKDEQDKQDQQDKDKQNKEQKDKEQNDKDKKDQEQKNKDQKQEDEKNKEQKEIPPSVSDKLKDMNMSEEKAKMILEAMKNQEVQYLQQNKRKPTKARDKSKPDW